MTPILPINQNDLHLQHFLNFYRSSSVFSNSRHINRHSLFHTCNLLCKCTLVQVQQHKNTYVRANLNPVSTESSNFFVSLFGRNLIYLAKCDLLKKRERSLNDENKRSITQKPLILTIDRGKCFDLSVLFSVPSFCLQHFQDETESRNIIRSRECL